MESVSIFWFRRDLRLEDNAGLYHALRDNNAVLPIFIFDKAILNRLEDKKDARVEFIYDAINTLNKQLSQHGSQLLVFFDYPIHVFTQLISSNHVKKVYTNNDYEPYSRLRDNEVEQLLDKQNIQMHSYKDQVIFEKDEILKASGEPYTVFTPYSKKWKSYFENSFYHKPYPCKRYFANFYKIKSIGNIPRLKEMGFESTSIIIPPKDASQLTIREYDQKRNFPGINGTSRLGIHFRFGTISIRENARKAAELNETYLNELIWRDFYMMILYHFPQVTERAFKPKYDTIEWINNEVHFKAWCTGKTGYPIVDAGMRELNATGYMHNRVRMIVASFLCKHLLIHWQWGEAYFAKKLLDFDLAANNGGWQWAAGSGCDAAPYFRIFNPYLQTEKFDKDLRYIRKWVPEIDSDSYPKPIVEHKVARKRALDAYKRALSEK